jgi:phosphatidylserine/phosphatidylglycerophosphate/cardiolipin synthase-like enzyme
VVLVLDAVGSRELKTQDIVAMKKAGITVNFFSNRLRRTHRKIVIIDKRITYFG